jgi:hypothetical protein
MNATKKPIQKLIATDFTSENPAVFNKYIEAISTINAIPPTTMYRAGVDALPLAIKLAPRIKLPQY